MFIVDSSDKERLPIVAEVLEEMARHQGLADRQIPFLIVANKQDLEESIDDKELTKFIQIDKLKTLNDLKYRVVATTGLIGSGVDHAFKLFGNLSR